MTKKSKVEEKTDQDHTQGKGMPHPPEGYTLARVGRARVILASGRQVTLNKLPKGSWVLVPI